MHFDKSARLRYIMPIQNSAVAALSIHFCRSDRESYARKEELKMNRIVMASFISAAVMLPAVGAVRAAVTSSEPLSEPAIPNGFGVNIHFRDEPCNLDLIADAGFKLIRMDLVWSGVERTTGSYDFVRSGYDVLTKRCTERGIRTLYILYYSNSYTSRTGPFARRPDAKLLQTSPRLPQKDTRVKAFCGKYGMSRT